jgi:hypothetical protein
MRAGKLVFSIIAAALLLVGLFPSASRAAGVMTPGSAIAAPGLRPERAVMFHAHSKRAISYYCYDRNYWWFYRPYGNGQEGYARCMPYFHYPPQAYGRGAPGDIK